MDFFNNLLEISGITPLAGLHLADTERNCRRAAGRYWKKIKDFAGGLMKKTQGPTWGLASVKNLLPDFSIVRLFDIQTADHERHHRDSDRIPQAVIDVAGRGHDRGREQR